MEKIILFLTVVITVNLPAHSAENYDLSSLRAKDLLSDEGAANLPEPSFAAEAGSLSKAPNAQPALDLSLKMPFSEINKRLAVMDISKIKAMDPSAAILSKKNDSIAFENISINYNGVEVEPSITLKPYFEGKNKLAIKVQKMEIDIAFGPTKSIAPRINKNEVMALAVDKMTAAIMESMDSALSRNKVQLRAKDLLVFSYDRETWTLHLSINPSFISPLMPGLISNINLSAFSFDEKGFTLKAGFNSDLIQPDPAYNLSVSDGLMTSFIGKFSSDGDFELLPKGHAGGVKFGEDGVIELSGKMHVKDMLLKPNVYFTARITPSVTAENTIRIHFDRINVDQAYGVGIPGFLNNWLQNKMISSALNAILTNPELKKNMTAKKIDDKTMELTMKNTSFLPSFAQGVRITGMKIRRGLVYLAFEL